MKNSACNQEEARLAALQAYSILDTAPEEAFDRITRLARVILGMPIVLISLIDKERQWFKSNIGLDVNETSRDVAFCTHTIKGSGAYVVPDARENALFRDNPLVTGAPFIRYYIGVPLTVPGGQNIGTLCAIDRQPRELSDDLVQAMCDLARLAIDQIELRQIAIADTLTGALTRRGFECEMGRELKRAIRNGQELSLLMVDVDHFKSVNDRFGHATGDRVLRDVTACIKSELRASDFIGRFGGEEFVIAMPETDLRGARQLAERIRRKIAEIVVVHQDGGGHHVSASLGVSNLSPSDRHWTQMLARADEALYEAKSSGRNKSVTKKAPTLQLKVA
jgi:diguanylate cyclase (GGDEF)-like protein